MDKNSLYEIKKFADENHLDFSKMVGTALVVGDFDLRDFNIKDIKIRKYNKIYQNLIMIKTLWNILRK